MRATYVTILLAAATSLLACSEPPPPRSVQAFLDNPIILEAALVRCAQNRVETRYDEECINARQANRLVMAEEEAKRRAAFEEQSERKRVQLRRAQEAGVMRDDIDPAHLFVASIAMLRQWFVARDWIGSPDDEAYLEAAIAITTGGMLRVP